MNQAANDLLLAGLRLRNQHSADTFQIVLDMLKRREQDPYLISLFDMMREMGEIDAKQTRSTKSAAFSMDVVRDSDPEKHALLLELQGLMTSKKIFNQKQLLVEFVSRKVPHISAKKTILIITEQYLDALIKVPIEEIAAELQLLKGSRRANPQRAREVDSFLRMADRIVES